ncbi:MAG: YihY/virulence factor BrkB family protein [Rhodobacteraceae bacterium]|nr:YihY/virulence factor BrkB family protein [Paracoccaceae bacterium]
MSDVAEEPAHLSLRLLRGVMHSMTERNLDLIAAGVAFYAMLAVFPAFAAVIALWGFVSDPAVVEEQLQMLRGLIPAEGFSLLDAQVRVLVEANSATLGWATVLSTGAALWSVRAGVGALLRGLNVIYGNAPRPGFWHLMAVTAATLGLIGLALAALLAVVVVPVVLVFLPLGLATGWALTAARWVLLVAVGLAGLWLIYRFAPNHAEPHSRWVSPGVLFALALWVAASWGFTVYLTSFGSYNQVYGSIGAVIVLLLWFYLTAYAILLGAALNAELSRHLDPDLEPASGPE